MDKEYFFNKGLPKWPQLMIVGDRVTPDQAKDIILRTDNFLTDPSDYSGGNNREWNEWYRSVSGLNQLKTGDWSKDFEMVGRLRSELGFVGLNYLHNTWASSSFIGGPYGFCSPKGEIFFEHNVGKWPSVEDVYNDFMAIATAWPFLNLKATLYSGESCEEDAEAVVSFIISGKAIAMVEEDLGLREYHSQEDMGSILNRLRAGSGYEQGIPEPMVLEIANIVKAKINEIRKIG